MSMPDLERRARLMDNFRHRAIGFLFGVLTAILVQAGTALLWE